MRQVGAFERLLDGICKNNENGKSDDMGVNMMVQPATRTECSTREAARLLGVSVSTVQAWVDSGELEAWKTVGGHRRISLVSVKSLIERQGASVVNSPEVPTVQPQQKVTVLVVEDDIDLLSLYEAVMSDWDLPMTLLTATNGFEGLVEVGRAQPDLLVTDLNMPGMDGFQMLRSLRANRRFDQMMIVVVSGLDSADIEAYGRLPEGVKLLRKPVPFEHIKSLVMELQTSGGYER